MKAIETNTVGADGAVAGHLGVGIWRLADPRITLASVASLLVGTAAAAREGPLSWTWLAVTALGIFLLEVAKNASGELVDFDSGTDLAVLPEDRSPFSGGKRVLVDGLLTRGQNVGVAVASYALGAAAGLAIVLWRESDVLWLGVFGVACAFFYHAPPVALSYRGLGELAVALCYGPLIAAGAFLVQRGSVDQIVILVSLPLGLLIAAFLWVNEFPDARADASAGKRTLVVRLGRPRASRAFAVLLGVAFVGLAFLPSAGAPFPVWLGFLGLPYAVAAARRVLRHPEETSALIPAQSFTLHAFLLYAVGVSVGLGVG